MGKKLEPSNGPWRWVNDEDWNMLYDSDGNSLLRYTNDDDGVHCPNVADKPLIEASRDMLDALEEAKLAFEYGAGCDENATYDVAESEIMSWTGSVGAVAYTRIIDAIAKAKGGAA